MILYKIIFLGIVSIIISIVISDVKKEYKLYLSLIFGIVAITMILLESKDKLMQVMNTFDSLSLNIENLGLLVKIVIIAYICDFISLVCSDLDYTSIGKKIEMSGKIIILVYSFDIVIEFINQVATIIGV